MNIPIEEQKVTDSELFEALDLEGFPALSGVKEAYEKGDIPAAKRAVVHYFETRTNVKGFFDYRQKPLKPVDLTDYPQRWQSFVGLSAGLDDYVTKAAEKIRSHIYLLPNGLEIDMGKEFEKLPHASQKDAQKVQQGIHIIMKRGKMLELLAVLYQKDGAAEWLETFSGLLSAFFEQYNLTIEEFSEKSAWFQYSENRESMDVGWLLLSFINLLQTRIIYDADTELAFSMIKRIWFLGMQFHRYDTDGFAPHNHHFFERGIVPYLCARLMPEFPGLKSMEMRGKEVILEHIEKDFTDSGAYSEHSIGYFFGATVSEMLFRVLYAAKVEGDDFFDAAAKQKINRIFEAACYLASPEECYPVVGDKGDILADEMIKMGRDLFDHQMAGQVLRAREGENVTLPLDFISSEAGFIVSRSSYKRDSNYFLMSAKKGCEMSSHDHMDMLSINIGVGGNMIFEESAAGDIYDRFIMGHAHRGFLYNQTSHNAVLAHGKPISDDSYYSVCWGTVKPDTIVDAYEAKEESVYLKAHHNGYGFCTIYREVEFKRSGSFFITDSVLLGGRNEAPHVQRWFLAKDCKYRELSKDTYLFERNGTKLLCRWQGVKLTFTFTKPEQLRSQIYKTEAEQPWMLDVSFCMKDDSAPENKTAQVMVRMTDVSQMAMDEIEKKIE